jgi:hypothetical protein
VQLRLAANDDASAAHVAREAAAWRAPPAPADVSAPSLVRVGVGCDRGLHRSVALAEAATARLVRKAEHARSGRNCPGLEALLRRVQLVDAHHRELRAGDDEEEQEEQGVEEGGAHEGRIDRRAELRLVGGV